MQDLACYGPCPRRSKGFASPSTATVLERRINGLLRSPAAQTGETDLQWSDTLAGSGYHATADASVVQLDIRVFYQVVDPSLCPAGGHVLAALDRLVTRSAVVICASRDLDILVARRAGLADSDIAEHRERLRAAW